MVSVRLCIHVDIVMGHLRLKPPALEGRKAAMAAQLAVAARLGKGESDIPS